MNPITPCISSKNTLKNPCDHDRRKERATASFCTKTAARTGELERGCSADELVYRGARQRRAWAACVPTIKWALHTVLMNSHVRHSMPGQVYFGTAWQEQYKLREWYEPRRLSLVFQRPCHGDNAVCVRMWCTKTEEERGQRRGSALQVPSSAPRPPA